MFFSYEIVKRFWVDCLCNSKIISTFAIVNEPTHEGEAIDVVVGGMFTRHIIYKASYTL